MFRKTQKGFTLVEVMIAAAALGALALVLLNLSKQTTKSSSKYQFDTEITLITNEINAILSDPIKCKATFNPTGAANITNPTNIDGKYYTLGSGQAPSGGYGNGGVNINGYALTIPISPSTDGLLNITFQNKKILKGSTGPATISKKINLYITQDAAGLITNCRSLSTSSTDIWSRGAGTDIYYNGGVRVGDQTQATVCDASTEGTQRYNKIFHQMEYCGASGSPLVYAWTGMGGGGDPTILADSWYPTETDNVIPFTGSGKILLVIQFSGGQGGNAFINITFNWGLGSLTNSQVMNQGGVDYQTPFSPSLSTMLIPSAPGTLHVKVHTQGVLGGYGAPAAARILAIQF